MTKLVVSYKAVVTRTEVIEVADDFAYPLLKFNTDLEYDLAESACDNFNQIETMIEDNLRADGESLLDQSLEVMDEDGNSLMCY